MDMTPKEILLNKIKECKDNYNPEYRLVIVETKSRNKYVCIDNTVMLNMDMTGYMRIPYYNENLETKDSTSIWDIERIYTVGAGFPKSNYYDTIWERPEIKEVTLEEIAEKFGVSVNNIRIKD